MPRGPRPAQPIHPPPDPSPASTPAAALALGPLTPRLVRRPAPRVTDDPPRVLVIEDDPLQARGLLRLLQSHGALCHAVESAEAAFLALGTLPPFDLILSDLQLPGASGAALAERLRRPLLVC